MRERLSNIITKFAKEDPRAVVLSGDHGYALFDEVRKSCPSQFINVGVMEQAMIGMAAGLAKTGARPIVYGLSAFVPIRVLEQIKLDVCYSNLPVIFLGDGAGLVYTTLGSSHQCGEDIAALRSLAHIRIYTPADEHELAACFEEAIATEAPSYIRIGKSDRPAVHTARLSSTGPIKLNEGRQGAAIVSMGSMASVSQTNAKQLGLTHYVLPRLKPFPFEVLADLASHDLLLVVEEHNRYGGLASAISDAFSEAGSRAPRISSFSLRHQFAEKCGSYQYALSEHDLDDVSLARRLRAAIEGNK